jgi:secondary thiamine-phosphate synthase enzyme
MKIVRKTFEYKTKDTYDVVDITDEVKEFIKESGIKDGLVNIQMLHTSTALMVNEYEPLLLEDIKRNLENTASRDLNYRHDDFSVRTVNLCDDECKNGHAHCKAIHLLPSATLNLADGDLQLGQWQRIMFIELDRSRPRKIQVQIIGE